MDIKYQNLADHLQAQLAPIYLICGDEPLIVEESCDLVIAQARARGFTERSVHHAEGNFVWDSLSQDAASMSLFAEKKTLDVRVATKKFDRQASEFLRGWVEDPANTAAEDHILLLRTGRLDKKQRSSAWFKALDKIGVTVVIWPVGFQELPRWLRDRGRTLGLRLDTQAAELLAARVEGNLLAAAQELEKMGLAGMEGEVTWEDIVSLGEDTSRYNTFDLLDAVMTARPERVARMIGALREEGTTLFAILGALNSQVRSMQDGPPKWMPRQRIRMLEEFQRRVRQPAAVISEMGVIEQQAKGQLPGDAWMGLERLLLRLAGVRQISLPGEDQKILML